MKALAFATSKSGDDAAAAKLYDELKNLIAEDRKLQTIVSEELEAQD